MDSRTPAPHSRGRSGWRIAALLIAIVPVLSGATLDRPLPEDAHSRPAAPAQFAFANDVELRVRLQRDLNSIVIDADGDLRIGEHRAGRFRDHAYAAPVEIQLRRSHYTLRDHRGKTASFSASHPLRIEARRGALKLDDVEYPGAFVLHLSQSAATFDVVEHVFVEEYLPGVLTRELYPGWSDAAYEAQAVAARSYALHERQRRLASGDYFDVESTTQDQAYGGANAGEKATRAVRATQGLVLKYQGAILRSYYSSTCGGRPGSARDTWPIGRGFEFNLAAPIQAAPRECPCDFSPRHRWTATRDIDRALTRMRAFGAAQGMAIRDIHSLKSITPIRHNAAQRPALYQVTDRQGATWRLSAESLRLALNHNGASGLGRPEKELTVWSGDLEITVEGDQLLIDGRGFGHGVGMCQFGAEGMARQGRSAQEILLHYYPGAELLRQ